MATCGLHATNALLQSPTYTQRCFKKLSADLQKLGLETSLLEWMGFGDYSVEVLRKAFDDERCCIRYFSRSGGRPKVVPGSSSRCCTTADPPSAGNAPVFYPFELTKGGKFLGFLVNFSPRNGGLFGGCHWFAVKCVDSPQGGRTGGEKNAAPPRQEADSHEFYNLDSKLVVPEYLGGNVEVLGGFEE